MGYHDYISTFSKEEKLDIIKEELTQSRDFVNIFLGFTVDKSDEDKNSLFNELVEHMANQIVGSELVG